MKPSLILLAVPALISFSMLGSPAATGGDPTDLSPAELVRYDGPHTPTYLLFGPHRTHDDARDTRNRHCFGLLEPQLRD
jgi:hypothetical protein